MIPEGVYTCEEHGARVDAQQVLDYTDGAVLVPGQVLCSECGAQLVVKPKE